MGANLEKVYNPRGMEETWYDYWVKGNYFHADNTKEGPSFSMVIPPPNVTGQLHMGHALDNTLQDIITRWRRMQGYNTLWLPGTDHAGIATQIKVEEQLRKKGLTRHDLGRDAFLELVWEWKEKYGNRITNQLKRLGTSCDWQRERFTLDEGCSKAVREVFVSLYEKGLIYRGQYLINWCVDCNTALSDVEVEHEDTPGKLYYIRYPFSDGEGYITVATTRPETMLGDTAVAVNPDDERYQDLVGRTLRLPLTGRSIPVIADSFVSVEFGTGLVKVTPAHDPNDYAMGERHALPRIQVIGEDGLMTAEAGKYAGLDRNECRKRVVADLKECGLLEKVEEHSHAVGHCYRCGSVVEPLISKQWFVKMGPLAKPAIDVVLEGRVKFVPERFTKLYLNWMENIRDWCISRQLWWGHRIPVWYCDDCGETIVSKEDPTRCPKCQSQDLTQDPDVLDTWFSSALWPFSTMGWPEQTKDLDQFYPTSLLVTGFDIIFFWVARMIVMGLEFTGEPPFSEVLIHGLVRDSEGRKMSKSLGNGVDPLEVIDEYGADALRFTLVKGGALGNDMRYYPEQVEASRNFANKVWNATRFALMNLEGFKPKNDVANCSLADRWILSRYQGTVARVTEYLDSFDLAEASRTLYEFIWNELCDWYVEMSKAYLYGHLGDEAKYTAQWVLWTVLDGTLRLLHPFMPFITEELWHALPSTGETIVLAPWPVPQEDLYDQDAEMDMALIMDVVRSIRNVRSEKQVTPGRKIKAVLHADDPQQTILQRNRLYLESLAGLGELEILKTNTKKPEQAIFAVASGVEIYLPLAGLLDLEEERKRLQGELKDCENEIKRCQTKLENEGFVKKAPPAVVEKERAKLAEYLEQKAKLEETLKTLV
ncbi:MAG: valine--tRNA ligase [Limnochordia bacterium]|nr:valine--tRNA ligase [Limnochordia bacterium]